MPRVWIVLIATFGVLGGIETAAGQYRPLDYYDYPPQRYYEGPYPVYDRAYPPASPYHSDPDYYGPPAPYYPDAGYDYDPRYGDPYGHRGSRYYDGYPDYDPSLRRRYPDHYGDDRVVQEEEPGTFRESEQGFDPRRPHLGDGTDAPSEQYYARRPRSCGEYYYWDGRACVDARKYPPYVGPKY